MDTSHSAEVPAGADPLTRQLLRRMVARSLQLDPAALPGEDENLVDHGLDSINTMHLISVWHRRGIEVGFPELMASPTLGDWWQLLSARNGNGTQSAAARAGAA